jgi:hypothetical protein
VSLTPVVHLAIRMTPWDLGDRYFLGKTKEKKSRDTVPLKWEVEIRHLSDSVSLVISKIYMCCRLPGDAGGRRRELLRTHGS